MKEVLNIINSNFIEKKSISNFYGNIYEIDKDYNLNIERNTLNYLINKINKAYEDLNKGQDLLTINSEMYLVFLNEIVEKSDSIWREDRNHYRIAILTIDGLVTLYSEETTGTNKQPDKPIFINWNEIDYVNLFLINEGDDEYYILRFFEKEGTSVTDIPLNRFGTNDEKSADLLVDLFNEINDYTSRKSLDASLEKKEKEKEITVSIERKEFKEGIRLLDNYSKKYDIDSNDLWFYYKNKAILLEKSGEIKESLFTINKMIELCNKLGDTSPNAHKIKGDILFNKGEILKAINCYAYSEENFIEEDNIRAVNVLKEEAYIEIKKDFINIPYEKRKLLFASNDIYNTLKNDLIVIKNDEIPDRLNFPIGHPHVNEVYTCHPLKQDFYIPLKDFQQDLFYDRVNEFTYLLQCLGATKIEIISSKNDSIEQNEKLNSNLEVEANNKITTGELNKEQVSNINNLTDKKIKIEKTQYFSPTKAPYIPETLNWYKTDISWQRLAEQRLTGNIRQHKETITSVQNQIISNQEIINVNAELRLLLPKVNVKYNKEHEINVNSKTSFEWIISVDFENTDLLEKNLSEIKVDVDNSNVNIEKYKEEVLFMLEDDNIIDDVERKLLNRKIKHYGLTPSEALQIEEELMFNEDELNYIEEFKMLLEEGSIGDIERKMLNRYAKRYNLNSDRQMVLELSVTK
ncbi:hypothetical protein [Lacinutrix undariae]